MMLREAAESLGVTPATLRQQIANGKLRARKLGRDWIVTPKEVERYRLESRREEIDYGPETPGYIGVDEFGHPMYEGDDER